MAHPVAGAYFILGTAPWALELATVPSIALFTLAVCEVALLLAQTITPARLAVMEWALDSAGTVDIAEPTFVTVALPRRFGTLAVAATYLLVCALFLGWRIFARLLHGLEHGGIVRVFLGVVDQKLVLGRI